MNTIPNISFKQTDNSRDFEVLKLSTLFDRIPIIKDHNPNKPHRVTFFALLMVTSGTGSHMLDLKEYDLEVNTVLKIAKGQIHAFQKKPTYDGYLIIFTENFVLNYFSNATQNLLSHFYNYHITNPISNNVAFNETFLSELNSELQHENHYANKNIAAALLELYLLRLERNSQVGEIQQANQKQYSLFNQFKSLVEAKYTITRNVKDYAEMMLISTKLLNQVVKAFTLNTVKTFIDDYIILEAKRSISISGLSLKEIAFSLGFDEATNFTKFFKKKVGISPKEFRDQQL
ncbi:MAG: helix-turn-helix domain-containing protein [Bacteroidetes bacterium]|nr:helix-turn-helix domain-containing protein [Bacteroidota bacterium]